MKTLAQIACQNLCKIFWAQWCSLVNWGAEELETRGLLGQAELAIN